MPAFMDRRKEEALLDSLRAISRILGKEQDYQAFIEWATFAEESGARPSLEEIAAHTPTWIQLLSPPLRKLYDAFRYCPCWPIWVVSSAPLIYADLPYLVTTAGGALVSAAYFYLLSSVLSFGWRAARHGGRPPPAQARSARL